VPTTQVASKPVAAVKAVAASKPAVAKKATGLTHAEIAQLAYRFWSERGHHHGSDHQDWLRAEQELKKGK